MIIRVKSTGLRLLLLKKLERSLGLVWSADILSRGLLRLVDTSIIIVVSIFMLFFCHENTIFILIVVVVCRPVTLEIRSLLDEAALLTCLF